MAVSHINQTFTTHRERGAAERQTAALHDPEPAPLKLGTQLQHVLLVPTAAEVAVAGLVTSYRPLTIVVFERHRAAALADAAQTVWMIPVISQSNPRSTNIPPSTMYSIGGCVRVIPRACCHVGMRSRFTIITPPNTRSTGPKTSQKTFIRKNLSPHGREYQGCHRKNASAATTPDLPRGRPTTLKPKRPLRRSRRPALLDVADAWLATGPAAATYT
jgi:hypothetical protein